MSLKTKNLLIRDYQARIGDAENALVISVRGVGAIQTNKMRTDLAKKNIRITVVQNSLGKRAIGESPLKGLGKFLEGPSALAYGGESVVDVAREIIRWAAQIEKLELKGAILDGELFSGKAGVERLSKFPTKDEAIAKVVTLVLSPAQKIVGAVKAPGANLLGVVKAIEAKLEKGEAIAKVG
jgi:large subunit ribosomal protein L10